MDNKIREVGVSISLIFRKEKKMPNVMKVQVTVLPEKKQENAGKPDPSGGPGKVRFVKTDLEPIVVTEETDIEFHFAEDGIKRAFTNFRYLRLTPHTADHVGVWYRPKGSWISGGWKPGHEFTGTSPGPGAVTMTVTDLHTCGGGAEGEIYLYLLEWIEDNCKYVCDPKIRQGPS